MIIHMVCLCNKLSSDKVVDFCFCENELFKYIFFQVIHFIQTLDIMFTWTV